MFGFSFRITAVLVFIFLAACANETRNSDADAKSGNGSSSDSVKSQVSVEINAENSFMEAMMEPSDACHLDDLDIIKQRKVLRVLTRNNGAAYYLYRGKTMGFEYELAKAFADELGVALKMVVVPSRKDLIPWLLEGKGDMIAAGMTVLPRRAEQVRFTYPYSEVTRVVLYDSRKYQSISSPQDLTEALFMMRTNGSYPAHLLKIAWDNEFDFVTGETTEKVYEALLPEVPTIKVLAAPSEYEDETIARMIVDGQADAMITDSELANIEALYRRELKVGMEVSDPRYHAWAVRDENPALWKAANTFIYKNRKSTLMNILKQRYFTKPRRVVTRRNRVGFYQNSKRLSPYDKLFRKYADRFDFDWRLVAAIAYQESQFDPSARSWAGAAGLMQLMPHTATSLGVTNPDSPEQSLRGGLKYLSQLIKRFDEEVRDDELIHFALASYNVGFGHIQDARLLAEQQGYDPERWFGNVEQATLLLQSQEYARRAKYGYCRCDETVRYVSEIKNRYEQYLALMEQEKTDDSAVDNIRR